MKIKRPLFIFVLSIFVVIYAINTMPKSLVCISLALFALFIIVHKLTKNRYTKALVLSFAAAVIGLTYFEIYNYNLKLKISEIDNIENSILTGTVKSENRTSASRYYTISADNINDNHYSNFDVLLYTNEYLEVGDKVELTGKYKSFTPKSNWMYNYGKGVFGYFYAENIIVMPHTLGFDTVFSHIRRVLTDNSRDIFSYDTVGTSLAMGLGNKNYLSAAAVTAFNHSGISHVLVVSGLHVGFIMAVLNMLMHYVPVHKKIKNIIVSAFVFMFMGIIGFTPSIVRAGFLIITMLIGRNLFLETDNYTVLAALVLITLINNPYSAVNASLLLSYCAYFGVICAAELCKEKNYGKVTTSLMLTTFAVLFTAPVLAVLGMDTTLLSPLFNLLLSGIVMIICILSFFLTVIYCVPYIGPVFTGIIAPFADVLIRFLLVVTEYISEKLSFAVINMGQEIILITIFATVIAFIVCNIQFDNKLYRKIVIFIVPAITVLCYNYMNRDVITVKVFDGSSEPSYIISSNKDNYLVMTENINERRFRSIMKTQNIDSIKQVIYCPEKYEECPYISEFSADVILVDNSETVENDLFTFTAEIEKRKMAYMIEVCDTVFVFNHKKTDLSGADADFYFFGSDVPLNYSAENSFWFYPVIKANKTMTEEKQAVELYDVLTVKINRRTGKYNIIKDVKNFGGQL